MAERKFIVLGDTTTHGGKVVSAWGEDGPTPMTIDGIPVACIGDKVTCPRCRGTHTIVEAASGPDVELEGRQIAREGDKVSDGSKLVSSGQSIATHCCEADDAARLAGYRAKVIEAQAAAALARKQAEAAEVEISNPDYAMTLESQKPRLSPNPISGPYNAPPSKTDKVANWLLDQFLKKIVGIGGIITRSSFAVFFSGMTRSAPLGGCDEDGCSDQIYNKDGTRRKRE